jgi:hypothetical protein
MRPDLFFNMVSEGGFIVQKKMLPVELIFVLYFQIRMLQSAGFSVKSQWDRLRRGSALAGSGSLGSS